MRAEQERQREGEGEKEIEWDKKSMQLVAPGHRENVRLHEGAGGGWRVSTERKRSECMHGCLVRQRIVGIGVSSRS